MRKSTKEFIEMSKLIHGDKYDYSLVDYKNNKTKVEIICKIHGIFYQTSKNHLINKQGCAKCAGVKLITTQEFIERSKLKHGDKYDYSLVNYKNSKSKVKIICKKHGLFEQIASNHITGQNCPICAAYIIIEKNKKFDKDIFLERAIKIHGVKYDYSLVVINSIYEKICIICKRHGEFLQLPHNHLKGQGCPNCKKSKNVEKICRFLENKNIEYLTEQTIEGCKSPKNKLMPFDIFIPKMKLYIEYDGEQHFRPVKLWGGEIGFKNQIIRDKIKTDFCLTNNINLLRISYKDNINEVLEKNIN